MGIELAGTFSYRMRVGHSDFKLINVIADSLDFKHETSGQNCDSIYVMSFTSKEIRNLASDLMRYSKNEDFTELSRQHAKEVLEQIRKRKKEITLTLMSDANNEGNV